MCDTVRGIPRDSGLDDCFHSESSESDNRHRTNISLAPKLSSLASELAERDEMRENASCRAVRPVSSFNSSHNSAHYVAAATEPARELIAVM